MNNVKKNCTFLSCRLPLLQSFLEDKETFGKDKNENKYGDKENEKMKMKIKKYIVRYLDFRASP